MILTLSAGINHPSRPADTHWSSSPLAAMREWSTGTAPQHQQVRQEGTEQEADDEMTENYGPVDPAATPPPTASPSSALTLQ